MLATSALVAELATFPALEIVANLPSWIPAVKLISASTMDLSTIFELSTESDSSADSFTVLGWRLLPSS